MPGPVETTRRPLAGDLASLAICTLIWGTTWRAIKFQVGAVPAIESIVYRFALAAALLFGWCALTRQRVVLSPRQHLAVFAQGLCGFSIQYACVYLAEERIASGLVAVIFAATAFINLIVFRIALRQRAAPLAWAGAALGLLGVAAMSLPVLAGTGGGAAVGLALAAAGVLAAALGNLFASRAQAAGVATAPSAAWAMGYGAALAAAWTVLSGQPWRFEPTPAYVGALVYLAVLGSVVAFLVFYSLARRRGYSFASYVAALTPPAAMAISSVFESVHWGVSALAGLALVIAGQMLMIRSLRAAT